MVGLAGGPAHRTATATVVEDGEVYLLYTATLDVLIRSYPAIGVKLLRNIAVMLSAWELVVNAPQLGPRAAAEIPRDPVRFLSIHWPLLDQFLRSHTEIFRFRVFGVSARGGGSTPKEIARLTKLDRPSDRVLVVDGAHRSNDLTRPVRWVLGLLESATAPDV